MNIPVKELTLRTSDGRERRQLAIVPNEAVRQDFYQKAQKNGLEIELRNINDENEK